MESKRGDRIPDGEIVEASPADTITREALTQAFNAKTRQLEMWGLATNIGNFPYLEGMVDGGRRAIEQLAKEFGIELETTQPEQPHS